MLKKETFFKIFLCLLVVFISALPQIWAYLKTPPGYFFTGVNSFINLNDIQGVYLPLVRNASLGQIFYENPYNPNQPPFFHHPVYLILGLVSHFFHLSPPLAYHLGSLVFGFFLLFFILKFLKNFFPEFNQRLLAFGWVIYGSLKPLVAEGSGFLSFALPHFLVAQLAFFSSTYFLLKLSQAQKFSPRHHLGLFFSVFLLSAVHPWMSLLLLALWLVWISFLFVKKQTSNFLLPPFFLMVLTSFPFLLYYANPERVPWVNFSLPSFAFMLPVLYGPLLLLSLLGAVKALKGFLGRPFQFLAFWFFLQVLFIYLPLPFQRRFIEGFYFPLSLLAVVGLDWLLEIFKIKEKLNLIYFFAFASSSLGALATYLTLILWLPNNFIYKSLFERQALQFLEKHSRPSEKILSLPNSGIFLPNLVNLKIFVGHGIQTPDFPQKAFLAQSFYTGRLSPEGRVEFLRQENLCYVYLGPEEKKITGFDFDQKDSLKKIYENKLVKIYQTPWCS